MNPTEQAAITRGIYNALMTFGVTFFTSYLTTDVVDQSVLIAAIAAFGVLGFRAGAEGLYDSSRQKAGSVTPADVNAKQSSGPIV